MPYDPKKYKSELGEAAFREARSAAGGAIPLGRTPGQLNRAKSLATSGANASTQQGQASLARNLGGTTSPLYAMLSSRMQMAGGAQAAGAHMDIDANEAARNQDLEMARRQQMLGVGQLGFQHSALAADTALGAERNTLQQQQINNQMALGQRNLGLSERRADVEAELGRGNLSLQTELGRGELDLRNRSLGAQTQLGYAGLDQRAAAAQMQFQLGMARLSQQQAQADMAFQTYQMEYAGRGMGGY